MAETSTSGELCALRSEVEALREDVARESEALARSWDAADDARAQNLGAYLALRRRDVTALQTRLSAFGLSSLGLSEAKVRLQLDALAATLRRLTGEPEAPYPDQAAFAAVSGALQSTVARLFGPAAPGAPRPRVMATLPTEAAEDAALAEALIVAGMDCARIDCAHDDAGVWARMIDRLRAAGEKHGRETRVLMDLGGPKCRVIEAQTPPKYRLTPGERVELLADIEDAAPEAIAFSMSFPQIVDQLAVGRAVSFDDGKAEAVVVEKTKGRAVLEVRAARAKGVRLKPDKGLNFPDAELTLPALTAKDLADLDFVAEHADLVGYAFVQRPADVERLCAELTLRCGGRPLPGIVLKIETPLAVRNLPRLIVASARRVPTAVMIARGDLAVETGFARLSEMQEEIPRLCEAAHTPVILAAPPLDPFAPDGIASRSEMTGAAFAQAAECVMLDKVPNLVEAVAFLRDASGRIDRRHNRRFKRWG